MNEKGFKATYHPCEYGLMTVCRMNNPFSGWSLNDVVRAAKKLALYYGAADSKDLFIRVSEARIFV